MSDLNTLSQFALNVEKLGIVGILAILACVFIWLYIKQSKQNTATLEKIADIVKETLENQKNLAKELQDKQSKLLDIIISRESRFRENDSK